MRTLYTTLLSLFLFQFSQQFIFSQNRLTGYLEEYRNDSCYFDEGPCNYLIEPDSANVWEVAPPAKAFFGEAYSPYAALLTDAANPYPVNRNDYAQFNIPQSLGFLSFDIWIDFWHKYQFDSLNDGGYIAVAFDTSIYKNIVDWTEGPEGIILSEIYMSGAYYSTTDTFGIGEHGFTGTESGWKYTRIFFQFDLPARLAVNRLNGSVCPDTVHLRFYLQSDSIDGGEAGWIIDNLVIGGDYESEIKNHEQPLVLKTYPNPARDEVYFYIPGNYNKTLPYQLINTQGTIMKSGNDLGCDYGGNGKMDISDLPPGIYLFRISADDEYCATIVKQ